MMREFGLNSSRILMRAVGATLPRALLLATLLPAFDAPGLTAQIEVTAGEATIRLSGRLQAQYATSSAPGAIDDFDLRRVRLKFDVGWNEIISARLQPEMSDGELELQDAWVAFALSPSVKVTMGQFKRAFDLIELVSSTQLSVIERDGRIEGVDNCLGVGGVCTYSRMVTKLGFAGRDQGVKVEVATGPVDLIATVTNGTGINTSDENDGKSFSGRAEWAFNEDLTLAGSLALHDFIAPDDDTEYATGWNVDLDYGAWADGPHLQAGVIGGENWKAAGEPTFFAWQAIGSWHFDHEGPIVGLEPLFRVSGGDPDTGVGNNSGIVWTPGMMLYLGGRNKFGFNLDVYSPDSGDTEASFKFQTFLYF
ncbi:MAG: porin [Longimicrobiales bacterium]|nr:porin [Longimicrobiales bacterium]